MSLGGNFVCRIQGRHPKLASRRQEINNSRAGRIYSYVKDGHARAL